MTDRVFTEYEEARASAILFPPGCGTKPRIGVIRRALLNGLNVSDDPLVQAISDLVLEWQRDGLPAETEEEDARILARTILTRFDVSEKRGAR
jgi:hypothetical protein